jgi:hypothetical protein
MLWEAFFACITGVKSGRRAALWPVLKIGFFPAVTLAENMADAFLFQAPQQKNLSSLEPMFIAKQ